MPIVRKDASGVSITLAIARLAGPGKAANTRPSMTKTSPSAAKKSDMVAAPYFLFSRMIYSENRCPLFGIMGYLAGAAGGSVVNAGSFPDGLLK